MELINYLGLMDRIYIFTVYGDISPNFLSLHRIPVYKARFSSRYNQLKIQEDDIRAYNAKMKPVWDAEKAEKAAKLNRENMLILAKETGTKVKALRYI